MERPSFALATHEPFVMARPAFFLVETPLRQEHYVPMEVKTPGIGSAADILKNAGSLLGGSSVEEILKKMLKAKAEADKADIPGFDTAELQQMMLAMARGEKFDVKEYAKKIHGIVFGTAAGAICGAAAGPGAASLCASAGKAAGEFLGGWMAAVPDGAQPTAESGAFDAQLNQDRAYFESMREEMILQILDKVRSKDLQDKAIAAVDAYFLQPEDMIDDFGYWERNVGFPMILSAFSCYRGTDIANECALRPAFGKILYNQLPEWSLDYSFPYLKPEWAEETLRAYENFLETQGIDIRDKVEFLLKENKKSPRWYGSAQQVVYMHQFYLDLRKIVWEALRKRLEEIIGDIFLQEAVRVQEPLVKAAAELGSELKSRAGCEGNEECEDKVFDTVSYAMKNLSSADVNEIQASIEKEFPASGGGGTGGNSRSSGWLTGLLVLGAAAGIYYAVTS